jgi:hypothetical protein
MNWASPKATRASPTRKPAGPINARPIFGRAVEASLMYRF